MSPTLSRPCLGLLALLGALALAVPAPARADEAPKAGKLRFYVGTYTGGTKSKGIYRCELDLATGALGDVELAGEATNPSFLALHPTGRFLYAVGEVGEFKGAKGGAVSAFAVDPKTGDLKLLNYHSSRGAGPCHVVVDKEGKNVLVANYGGGNVAVLPVGEDGKLGAATGFAQHEGSSVNKARQEKPHAHSINLDPANRFAFAADLGTDKVHVYRFDAGKGTITPNDPPAAAVAPGAGPRHFAFHPTGRFAYVINELKSTVTAFRYDPDQGELKEVQTVPTLTKPVKGNSTAEVQVHPSGKFLYGSNRGHDSIVAFAVDPDSGKLTYVGHQGDKVKVPRNFCVDPTGRYVVVANQGADSLVVFRVDPKTGALSPTGHSAKVAAPVCIKFVPGAGK
jgi:6-phosphogluconolactonase